MRLNRNLAVTAALVAILAFPLQAQQEAAKQPVTCCDAPKLTPEQTAKIQKITVEQQKAMTLLKADLKVKRLELQQLMNEGADQKKLESKIDEIAKVSADIQKKCLAHCTEIRNLLTDEQKKTMGHRCLGMGCDGGCRQAAGCASQSCCGAGCSGCCKAECCTPQTGRMACCKAGEKASFCGSECIRD